MSDKTVPLPDMTVRELQILLAGLDELPGKISRVLYDKIVGHVIAFQKDVPDTPSTGA